MPNPQRNGGKEAKKYNNPLDENQISVSEIIKAKSIPPPILEENKNELITLVGQTKQDQTPLFEQLKPTRISDEELDQKIGKMDKLRQVTFTARPNSKHPVNELTILCKYLLNFDPAQSFFHNIMSDGFAMLLENCPEFRDKLCLIADQVESYSNREAKEREEFVRNYILNILREHVK